MDTKDLVAIVAAMLLAGGRGPAGADSAKQISGVVELARSVVREAQGKDNTDV